MHAFARGGRGDRSERRCGLGQERPLCPSERAAPLTDHTLRQNRLRARRRAGDLRAARVDPHDKTNVHAVQLRAILARCVRLRRHVNHYAQLVASIEGAIEMREVVVCTTLASDALKQISGDGALKSMMETAIDSFQDGSAAMDDINEMLGEVGPSAPGGEAADDDEIRSTWRSSRSAGARWVSLSLSLSMPTTGSGRR